MPLVLHPLVQCHRTLALAGHADVVSALGAGRNALRRARLGPLVCRRELCAPVAAVVPAHVLPSRLLGRRWICFRGSVSGNSGKLFHIFHKILRTQSESYS